MLFHFKLYNDVGSMPACFLDLTQSNMNFHDSPIYGI
jgi:hypothetical protein